MKLLRFASIKTERSLVENHFRKVSRPPLKKKENVHATINHSRDRVSGALDKIQLAHHYKSRQPLYPNRTRGAHWKRPSGNVESQLFCGGGYTPRPLHPLPSSLSLTPQPERGSTFFFFSLFSSASRGYRGRMIDNRSCRTCRRLAYPTKMNSFCAQS